MGIDLSLYKIADALQIPITYRDGKATGERGASVKTLLGFDLPFTIKAVKLFMNDQCGLLAHIRGDLYIIVSHFQQTGSISAYLIDAGELSMDGVKAPPELFISKSFGLPEVYAALKDSMVAAFSWKGDQWKPLKLPK